MIEITRFRPQAGTDAADVLDADARLQAEFAYQQPGLLRRTTARAADGEWVVITLWRAAADADASADRSTDDPIVHTFMELVDAATLQISRYEDIGG